MESMNKAIEHDLYSEYRIPVKSNVTGLSDHEPYMDIEHNAPVDSISTYESMQNEPQKTHEVLDIDEGSYPKAAYKHTATGNKYLVKPYHYGAGLNGVGDGWSEMTARSMYNAGNIPHLIHKTHVTMGNEERDGLTPMLVIHMEKNAIPATNIGKLKMTDAERHRLYPDKMKIAAMDFLTNHIDRHGDNLLFHVSPHTGTVMHPIAIDNGAFDYGHPLNFNMGIQAGAHAFRESGLRGDVFDYAHAGDFSSWWKNHGPLIKLAFEKQLPHIFDQQLRNHVAESFNERYAHLDKKVDQYQRTGKWEYK